MLLLQFAFIYTTAYVRVPDASHNTYAHINLFQGLYGALAELAQRPEYIPALREEVEVTISLTGVTVAACDKLVLLDSFLKECQRLHPPAAGMCMPRPIPVMSGPANNYYPVVSAHRVCVKAVPLSNGEFYLSSITNVAFIPDHGHGLGVVLEPGTHVGVPSGWIQRSSKAYTDPETFDGFRFARSAAAGASGTKLVDLSPDYLVFGMDVHAWSVVPLFLSFLSWVLVFPGFFGLGHYNLLGFLACVLPCRLLIWSAWARRLTLLAS